MIGGSCAQNCSHGDRRQRRGAVVRRGRKSRRRDDFPSPAGPYRDRVSARRPDRFRRPRRRREDDATRSARRVVIDNKPGANGTLGGEFVAKSDPDGYTLFLTTAGAVTVSPHIMADIHYDALRDFAPVALVTTVTEVLAVTPKSGIKTVKELVALAKEKPGTISFASTGIGSPPHLAQELLDASAGVKFLHVPYRGAAPALTDLLAGQVQVLSADIPVLISQIKAGNLVADRRGGEQARRHPARRADACRARLSQHRRIELVRAARAGEDASRGDRTRSTAPSTRR